jgi:hypothetical protein
VRVRRALWALPLALAACAKLNDPTAIFAPPPAAPSRGVQLKLGRQGDGAAAVTHVWVEDSTGADILTLSTTTGLAVLSVPNQNTPSTFCADGMSFYWPSYCAANPGNLTDANSHATAIYNSDSLLIYVWDWTDRSGATVPDGTYFLKAELSGYPYSDVPAEASVTVTKNGASGGASGSAGGAWLSASAVWNP